LLPEIARQQKSIKNSLERKAVGYLSGPSPAQNYDKNYDELVHKLKNPVLRNNNSIGMKGVFGSGAHGFASNVGKLASKFNILVLIKYR
jgi:hypothetical protein